LFYVGLINIRLFIFLEKRPENVAEGHVAVGAVIFGLHLVGIIPGRGPGFFDAEADPFVIEIDLM